MSCSRTRGGSARGRVSLGHWGVGRQLGLPRTRRPGVHAHVAVMTGAPSGGGLFEAGWLNPGGTPLVGRGPSCHCILLLNRRVPNPVGRAMSVSWSGWRHGPRLAPFLSPATVGGGKRRRGVLLPSIVLVLRGLWVCLQGGEGMGEGCDAR